MLLQYLTGPEGMAEWTGQGLALPSREDVEPAPGREALSAGLEYAHRVGLRAGLPRHPGGVQRRADEGSRRGRHGPGGG